MTDTTNVNSHQLNLQEHVSAATTFQTSVSNYETAINFQKTQAQPDDDLIKELEALRDKELQRIEELKKLGEQQGKGFLDDLFAFVETNGDAVIKFIIKHIFGGN